MQDHDLLEFEKLKDEQIGRLTYRDTLFYFTMTIIGGALAIACSERDKQAAEILLIVPYTVFIAGVAHITCDRRIEDIGIYIRDELAAVVARKSNADPSTIFAWEQFFRRAQFHTWRKFLQFIANEMLYAVSGGAALFFYLLRKGQASGNNAASPFTLSNAEMWLWWGGLTLMIFMWMLIIIFTFVKSRPHKLTDPEERWALKVLRRTLVFSFSAAAAASAVNAERLVPPELLTGLIGVRTLPLQALYFGGAIAAIVTGFLLLLLSMSWRFNSRRAE